MDSPTALSDLGDYHVRQSSDYDSDEEPDDAAYAAMLSSDSDQEESDGDDGSGTHPSLCRRCSAMVAYANSSPLTPYDTTKLINLSSFEPSTCELCRILYDAVVWLHGQKDMNDWKFRISFLLDASFSLAARRFEDADDNWASTRSGCDIEFYCPDGCKIPCPWGIFSPSRLSRVTTSRTPDLYKKAKAFVDDCTANHECWNADATPVLPSRVLDLGSDNDQIRLFETRGMRAQYICLSHCWGDYQPVRTTLGNLADHLNALPFSTLPRTYQMAISLARFFGIRYIWIDSLCIIQDDSSDWASESAKMCDIYEGSFLTIAATSSPNCSFDLFTAPAPEIFSTSGQTAAGQPYHVLARDRIPHPGITSKQDDIVKFWPLLNRAWVLQERLLAPRVLHLGTWELIWECRRQTQCECSGMSFAGQAGDVQRFRGPYSKVSHYETLQKVDQPSLTQAWHDIVQWYTKLRITYHSDRLPGLSGLAKQMASKRRARYLAGLWEDSLPLDLLWERYMGTWPPTPNAAKADEAQAAKAPSWSWASCSRAIIFPFNNLNDNALEKTTGYLERVYPASITASVEPATSDPTGNVKNCSLTIAGKAFEAVITGWNLTWKAVPNVKPYEWRIQVQAQPIGDQTPGLDMAYFERFAALHFDNEAEYQSNPPDGGRVLCVPIARVTRFQDQPPDVRQTDYALLLRECGAVGASEYRRVGILEEFRSSELQRYREDPAMLWDKRASCLAALGDARTINVV